MICAKCGEEKDLCQSVRIDNIQQPRICKECLMKTLDGDKTISDLFWLIQLGQAGDSESIENLKRISNPS